MTAPLADRLARARLAVDVQMAKYDEALGVVPYVALLQIDRKLVRLERELDVLLDERDAALRDERDAT